MVMQQDASDPTGVATVSGREHNNSVVQARHRKAAAALQMSLAGSNWTEIAQAMGYPTPRTARVAVEKALERELRASDDSVEKMRKMAGQRLERLIRAVWPKAIDPNHPDQLAAVEKARALVDRHAKLYGLDAPTEIIVSNPTMTEIERWVAAMQAAKNGAPVQEGYDVIAGQVIPSGIPAG